MVISSEGTEHLAEKQLSWLGMTLAEMEQVISDLGEAKYRAGQLSDWIYRKNEHDFAKMSNLSAFLRSRLNEISRVDLPGVVELYQGINDPVTKALVCFQDEELAECVLMRYPYGNSVCVSTQVGCRMACRFCASGSDGFLRDLSAGEIVGQVLLLRSLLSGEGNSRISHLVFMGMGEPLDNIEQVIRVIQIVNAPWGLGIGYRHITVSTCGLIEGIERLTELNLPLNLAISLHASDDDLRRELMPVAHKYKITDLIATAVRYSRVTGRRVTYEYGMIAGINDKTSQAEQLARLLKGSLSHVNLIPFNNWQSETAQSAQQRSSPEVVAGFAESLRKWGIEVTVRREMGADISAACGQLRRSRRRGT